MVVATPRHLKLCCERCQINQSISLVVAVWECCFQLLHSLIDTNMQNAGKIFSDSHWMQICTSELCPVGY